MPHSDDNTPRAIETRYRKHRFRSRLEARWAVFLDALGVTWEYEPEGYVLLDGTCYLPDFWLPESYAFVEIKGQSIAPGDEAWMKAQLLAEATGCAVTLFCGSISEIPAEVMGIQLSPNKFWGDNHDDYFPPMHVWWFQCPVCHRHDLAPQMSQLPCRCVNQPPNAQMRVTEACARARGARFEFGEHG